MAPPPASAAASRSGRAQPLHTELERELPADSLGAVASEDVGDLMTERGRQASLVPRHGENSV
jgi:hypothetical protein